MSSNPKPSFAAMAASSRSPTAAPNTPKEKKDAIEALKVAPLTPPLSDPVPSGTVSPSAPISFPPSTEGNPASPDLNNLSISDKWKAVGSPPRRKSIPHINLPAEGFELKKAEDEGPISRSATSPGVREDESRASNSSPDHQSNWGKLGGMQWNNGGNSIWNDAVVATKPLAPPAGEDRRLSLKPQDLIPGGSQSRKFSLSAASESEEYDTLKNDSPSTYAKYVPPAKARSRSKSSSAIFGLLAQDNDGSDVHQSQNAQNQMWSMQPGSSRHDNPSLMHRRSSTQPSGYNAMWDSRNDDGMGLPSAGQLANYRLQERRFSHAPVLNSEYVHQLLPGGPNGSDVGEDYSPAMDMRRRHSVAGPLYASGASNRYLADALENINLDDIEDVPPTYNDIDDYFENTEHRTRAWVEAGKNLQMQSFSQHWPLYVVEFKAGRHDFFFVDDPSMVVKKGDLAIVEADRGKDLGKVIHDNIQNLQQLQLYQANHVDLLAESQFGKDVHPKRIYRLAVPNEVALLVAKSQDEAKAMAICQSKIRQKKLPMEVVDAEYQWDRRKLTLYFVADRRIDFRELVRDLFKIYKTRIWMCAVNPLKVLPQKE